MTRRDLRTHAYSMAGPGNERRVDAIARDLHYNESIHMHNLADDNVQHGACEYCWLRAGRAVRALVRTDLLTVPEQMAPKPSAPGPVRPGQIWADKYPGNKGRTVRVAEVEATHAVVEVATEADNSWSSGNTLGRRTRVGWDRKGLRGYRLVSEPDGGAS